MHRQALRPAGGEGPPGQDDPEVPVLPHREDQAGVQPRGHLPLLLRQDAHQVGGQDRLTTRRELVTKDFWQRFVFLLCNLKIPSYH